MSKQPGQDFEEFMKEARQDPEISAYLDSFSVAVADAVLARRLALGWSQRKLAEQAGTTQARISQIEAGFEGIKMETLNKVFRALGLKQLTSLFTEEAVASA
ncbi:helix-turn-helix domain-containing protein [Paenibacillus polymyxa]|uniref:helix-turn-helix domain-containing protein n=1 Tax=Paenibacillus polymyxa TaxID=1406 RepID=UPI002AB5C782|nr:helix-turn-helix domain-containing protein [Paenibacillus polymyxa]MDY7989882.1 helix-turn-helix domain-containing protein [Paenibacillus polymyxa]MDY8116759.1 helix-turn-helix domain-containing protein [Paenibacillus polymyxa]